MGLLDKLRPDPKCTRCARTYAACICSRSPAKAITQRQPRQKDPRKR